LTQNQTATEARAPLNPHKQVFISLRLVLIFLVSIYLQ
jgi:hypothetical protein